MNLLVTLAVLVVCTSTAHAAPDTYVIDSTHTFPQFSYTHLGYSSQTHGFDKTSGKVTLDRAAQTGSADVTIDATSVHTGYALFNGVIQGADYFDTARYPTITFKSSKMTFEGNQPVSLVGDLTIKGVTKPVTLTLTHFLCMPHPMLKVVACGANATASIKRSDFNMGKGVPYVSDEIALSLAIEALKQPSTAQ